jgi:hypothetical protein
MAAIVQTLRRFRAALEFLTAVGVLAALLAVIASPVDGAKAIFLLAMVTVIAAALGSVALTFVLDLLAPYSTHKAHKQP